MKRRLIVAGASEYQSVPKVIIVVRWVGKGRKENEKSRKGKSRAFSGGGHLVSLC